jgi:hypothetical protein
MSVAGRARLPTASGACTIVAGFGPARDKYRVDALDRAESQARGSQFNGASCERRRSS